MTQKDRQFGYIRTLADLDAAARALDRNLEQAVSPQKRFLLITDFYRQARGLPSSWLHGYVLYLIPMFLELLRMSFMRSTDPSNWAAALDLLAFAKLQGWDERFPSLDTLRWDSIGHLALSYAFVSSLRDLHAELRRHGVADALVSEREWTSIYGSGATAFEMFQEYVGILEQHGEQCVSILKQGTKRWEAFLTHESAVSVILLEDDALEHTSSGRVLLMDIHESESGGHGAHLGNTMYREGGGTLDQLRRAQHYAEKLVEQELRVRLPQTQFTCTLHESRAEYLGESLGLAAAAGIAALVTQKLNSSQRWYLAPSTACIGGLDENGNAVDSGWKIMERKVITAFYSPIETIVLPALHREAAMLTMQRLHRRYPHRTINVVGVHGILDLPSVPGVYGITDRSRYDRLREFMHTRAVLLLSILVLILIGGGGYFAYQAYYDFPNLEHSLGLSVGANAIVFNPKDSVVWCFRDHDKVKTPVIPFGDLEVGDAFTRNFWLWNVAPNAMKVNLSIEGPDSLDWYLNWRRDVQFLEAAKNIQFSVMFAPLSIGSNKHARLVLRDASTQRMLYYLYLTGAAGQPLPAGYALRFDGVDDMLFFGRRSTAFDVVEGTFECWVRPDTDGPGMILHNGLTVQSEQATEDVFLGFHTLDSIYIRVGSEMEMIRPPDSVLPTPGNWTHLALAYSIPRMRVSLYVDGVRVFDRTRDFIFERPGVPFVTVGAQNTGRDQRLFFKGEIDEMRFWNVYRSEAQVRETMHGTVNGLTPGLSGYWDMDATVEHTVFNANVRAHSGTLLNRPTVVRSTAPLVYEKVDVKLIPGPSGRPAIELQAGRYLACSRAVLPRFGPASFAFWFYYEGRDVVYMSYVNDERGWLSIEDSLLSSSQQKLYFHRKLPWGWHHAVCTVEEDGKVKLYVNGEIIAGIRTTSGGLHDWHYRFEGLLLGFRFDKQRQLSSKYYRWYHPTLNHPRRFADLHVWKRLLDREEILGLYSEGLLPKRELVVSWMLDQLPDRNKNYIDSVKGYPLHIKQVRFWE